jgi:hypothetical protein
MGLIHISSILWQVARGSIFPLKMSRIVPRVPGLGAGGTLE